MGCVEQTSEYYPPDL